jgi:hypothetical protein
MEERMLRNGLIALAAGTVVAVAPPLAAQSTGQPASGPDAAAQTNSQTQADTPAEAAAAADQNAQPADPKAKAKANPDAACQNVVAAGPNRGQVIGKCKDKPKTTTDADPPPKQ